MRFIQFDLHEVKQHFSCTFSHHYHLDFHFLRTDSLSLWGLWVSRTTLDRGNPTTRKTRFYFPKYFRLLLKGNLLVKCRQFEIKMKIITLLCKIIARPGLISTYVRKGQIAYYDRLQTFFDNYDAGKEVTQSIMTLTDTLEKM